jgi:para-nitrobenzyl esterase
MKKSNLGSGSFQPSVDHVLISEPPISLLAKGHGKPIPMLIGSTQDELSVIEHPLLKHHWDFSPALQEGLSLENEAFIRKIQSLYNDYYGAKLGRIQFFSDILFKSAGLFYGQAASSKSPVWFYRLDYRPSRMDMTRLGAFHSSQLPLIFGNLKKGLGKAMFGLSRKLDEPKSIAGSMQEDIVRFMENGVLPWQQATPSLQESKIYNDKIQYQPMIPNKLYALLKQTDYYKRTQDHTYAEKRHQLAKKK